MSNTIRQELLAALRVFNNSSLSHSSEKLLMLCQTATGLAAADPTLLSRITSLELSWSEHAGASVPGVKMTFGPATEAVPELVPVVMDDSDAGWLSDYLRGSVDTWVAHFHYMGKTVAVRKDVESIDIHRDGVLTFECEFKRPDAMTFPRIVSILPMSTVRDILNIAYHHRSPRPMF